MKVRVVLSVLFSVFALDLAAQQNDNLRQALKGAVDNARSSIAGAAFKNSTVAVLPLKGRQGIEATEYLKTTLTQVGCNCVEGKEDPAFDAILKEIAWDTRNDDILAPDTIAALGKLKGAQVLVYGSVTEVSETPERVFAEISLHASDVNTKQHLWGGVFASRFYPGKDIQGIVIMEPELRQLLKDGFDAAMATMKSPEYASKLSAIKNATVIPLSGDIDQYITGLLIGGLTATNVAPVYPQIPSLSLIRSYARDGKLATNAIVYGAVRDLSERKKSEIVDIERMKKQETFLQRAEIQVFMEDVRTGHILWSTTIARESPKLVVSTVNQDDMKDQLIVHSPKILRYIIGTIVAIVLLFIILRFIRAIIVSDRLR